MGGVAENLVAGRGLQLPNRRLGDYLLDFGVGAVTFGYTKGMGKYMNGFVAEEISSSVGRPTGRVSILVGSLLDYDAHPRATYQEVSGLLRAANSAGTWWNAGMVAFVHLFYPIPEG